MTQVDDGKKFPPSSPACNTRSRRQKALVVEHKEKDVQPISGGKEFQRIRNDGVGSMANFVALREQQRKEKQARKVVLDQPDSQTSEKSRAEATAECSKRKSRGKTRMAKIHMTKFQERKSIPLNDKFQPASSVNSLISGFSSFLGTLVRNFVPFTYISWHKFPHKDNLWEFVKEKYIIAEEGKYWVLRTMCESWKGYKSRVKSNH